MINAFDSNLFSIDFTGDGGVAPSINFLSKYNIFLKIYHEIFFNKVS
jgi:hypothetical protein